MIKSSIIFWLIASFGDFKQPNLMPKETNVDSMFTAWNRMTYHSLYLQNDQETDSARKGHLINRLQVFRDIFIPQGENKIYPESLRYKFLKELSSHIDIKRTMFVIEANESGAKVLIRNFVVYPHEDNSVDINIYILGPHGWMNKAELKNVESAICEEFKSNRARSLHGYNPEDIIVTRFERGTASYSDYFLDGSLSKSSGVKEILDTYNMKNIHWDKR